MRLFLICVPFPPPGGGIRRRWLERALFWDLDWKFKTKKKEDGPWTASRWINVENWWILLWEPWLRVHPGKWKLTLWMIILCITHTPPWVFIIFSSAFPRAFVFFFWGGKKIQQGKKKIFSNQSFFVWLRYIFFYRHFSGGVLRSLFFFSSKNKLFLWLLCVCVP